MKPSEVRYYLHNIDGLKQEISDITADLEQYRAMSSDNFRVNMDPDPYRDKPKGTQYFPIEPGEPFSNTMVRPMNGHYNDSSQVENLVVHRVSFIEKQEQKLFKLKNILSAINCVVYYLDPVDKKIIYLRYSEHMGWKRIAKEMSFDYDYTRAKDCKIINLIIKNYAIRLETTHNTHTAIEKA